MTILLKRFAYNLHAYLLLYDLRSLVILKKSNKTYSALTTLNVNRYLGTIRLNNHYTCNLLKIKRLKYFFCDFIFKNIK